MRSTIIIINLNQNNKYNNNNQMKTNEYQTKQQNINDMKHTVSDAKSRVKLYIIV